MAFHQSHMNTKKAQEFEHIAMISGSGSPLDEELTTRLAKRNWKIRPIFQSITEAFRQIFQKKANLLILFNQKSLPATTILRRQVTDFTSILTPTMVIYDTSLEKEKPVMKTFGYPTLIKTNANAVEFIEAFEFLLRQWQAGPYKQLDQARKLLTHNQTQKGLKLLTDLTQNPDAAVLAAISLSRFLYQSRKLAPAEKLLLSALEKSPTNNGILAALVDLYINIGMPDTALRFLDKSKKHFGTSSAFLIDYCQAFLMIRDFKSSQEILEIAAEKNFMPQLTQFFLARFYFATGQKNQLKALLENQNATFEKYRDDWSDHLNSA